MKKNIIAPVYPIWKQQCHISAKKMSGNRIRRHILHSLCEKTALYQTLFYVCQMSLPLGPQEKKKRRAPDHLMSGNNQFLADRLHFYRWIALSHHTERNDFAVEVPSERLKWKHFRASLALLLMLKLTANRCGPIKDEREGKQNPSSSWKGKLIPLPLPTLRLFVFVCFFVLFCFVFRNP